MPNFLELIKREIINFGENSSVIVKGNAYKLGFKDAFYIGSENTKIIFDNDGAKNPTKFHIDSAARNTNHFTQKTSLKTNYKLLLKTIKVVNYSRVNQMNLASENLNYVYMHICKTTNLR